MVVIDLYDTCTIKIYFQRRTPALKIYHWHHGTRPVIREIQKDQDRFCPCNIIYKIDKRTEILHPGFPYTSRFP